MRQPMKTRKETIIETHQVQIIRRCRPGDPDLNPQGELPQTNQPAEEDPLGPLHDRNAGEDSKCD
jgi:hypothetical protein